MLSPAVCMWIVDDDYGWNKLKFVTRRAPMPASWLSHTLGRRRISPLSSCQKSGDMKAPSTRMVRMRQAGQGLSPAPIGTKWHQVPSSSTPSGADAGGKITSARRLSEKNLPLFKVDISSAACSESRRGTVKRDRKRQTPKGGRRLATHLPSRE